MPLDDAKISLSAFNGVTSLTYIIGHLEVSVCVLCQEKLLSYAIRMV